MVGRALIHWSPLAFNYLYGNQYLKCPRIRYQHEVQNHPFVINTSHGLTHHQNFVNFQQITWGDHIHLFFLLWTFRSIFGC